MDSLKNWRWIIPFKNSASYGLSIVTICRKKKLNMDDDILKKGIEKKIVILKYGFSCQAFCLVASFKSILKFQLRLKTKKIIFL